MRPQIVIILAQILSLLSSTAMRAQLSQGGGTPPPPPPTPPPELPLDSGILVLLAAGIIYGGFVAFRRVNLSRNRS